VAKKKDWQQLHKHLFEKAPRDFRVGRAVPPKKDLSRFVKWPRYIRIQRQRAILKKRLKIPASIFQFNKTLEKNQAANLFRLLAHYRPETRDEKKERLVKTAASEVKGDAQTAATKPKVLKFGLNHITTLVEQRKAKLVIIAHDVDPVELVVWLPSLCRKMNVPFCIVKGKARLGHLVHQKTAAVLALTDLKSKDHEEKLNQIVENVRPMYAEATVKGGGILGNKAIARIRLREQARQKDAKI